MEPMDAEWMALEGWQKRRFLRRERQITQAGEELEFFREAVCRVRPVYWLGRGLLWMDRSKFVLWVPLFLGSGAAVIGKGVINHEYHRSLLVWVGIGLVALPGIYLLITVIAVLVVVRQATRTPAFQELIARYDRM